MHNKKKHVVVKELRKEKFLLIGSFKIGDILNSDEHIEAYYEIEDSKKKFDHPSNKKQKRSNSSKRKTSTNS